MHERIDLITARRVDLVLIPRRPSPGGAWSKIKPRHGIVSFFHLHGGDWDPQGHIDLVEPTTMSDLQCLGSCYWSSTEVWFWPLK